MCVQDAAPPLIRATVTVVCTTAQPERYGTRPDGVEVGRKGVSKEGGDDVAPRQPAHASRLRRRQLSGQPAGQKGGGWAERGEMKKGKDAAPRQPPPSD